MIPEFKGTVACGLSSAISSIGDVANRGKSESKKIDAGKQRNSFDNTKRLFRNEEGERKRIESIKRQRGAFGQRQKIISSALKAVDQSTSSCVQINKKIKFESSSSDEEITERPPVPHVVGNGGHSKSTDKSKRQQLFDDDDNNNETTDVNLEFGSNKLNGEAGAKLLELQSRYGNVDERFRMDARFLDEDGQQNERSSVDDQKNANDAVELKERNCNLRVLEKVLGKPLITANRHHHHDDAQKKATSSNTATPYLRYDPENPSHRQLQVSKLGGGDNESGELSDDDTDHHRVKTTTVASSSTSSSESSASESDNNVPPCHQKEEEIRTGLDPEFADSLRRKQSSNKNSDTAAGESAEVSSSSAAGFSLRNLFGREDIPKSVEAAAVTSSSTAQAITTIPSWLTTDQYESSSDDATEDGEKVEAKKNKNEEAAANSKKLNTAPDRTAAVGGERILFFLHGENDRRILDGEQFRRTDSVEDLRAKWQKQRFGLINFYKSRRKEALKKRKRHEAKEEVRDRFAYEAKPEKMSAAIQSGASTTTTNTMRSMLMPRVLMNGGGGRLRAPAVNTEKR